MRRKAIIVLAITFMVTVMVAAFSYLYISQILRQRITNAYEGASRLTQQLAYFAENDLPDLSSTRIDTNDPTAVRRALAEYLPMDTNLLNSMESDTSLWPYILDISVVDANGKALLHSNAQLVGKQIAPRPDFLGVTSARFLKQLRLVYKPAAIYDVTYPLALNGEPFGTIRIGVSTVLLKSEVTPRLMHSLYFSIASIFTSLLLAAMISNVALGPLRKISRNLDSVPRLAQRAGGGRSQRRGGPERRQRLLLRGRLRPAAQNGRARRGRHRAQRPALSGSVARDLRSAHSAVCPRTPGTPAALPLRRGRYPAPHPVRPGGRRKAVRRPGARRTDHRQRHGARHRHRRAQGRVFRRRRHRGHFGLWRGRDLPFGEPQAGRRLVRQGTPALGVRHGFHRLSPEFPHPQPDYQWHERWRPGGGRRPIQWLGHHGEARAGPGPGGLRHPRQHHIQSELGP